MFGDIGSGNGKEILVGAGQAALNASRAIGDVSSEDALKIVGELQDGNVEVIEKTIGEEGVQELQDAVLGGAAVSAKIEQLLAEKEKAEKELEELEKRLEALENNL